VPVLACGEAPGQSSSVDVGAAGDTVAGRALDRFDADGRACLSNRQAADLVLDVPDHLQPGAFDDVADVRVLDTRTR
jgi:hypothetical protein